MKTFWKEARIVGAIWVVIGLLLLYPQASPGFFRPSESVDSPSGEGDNWNQAPLGTVVLAMGVLTVALVNHQLLKTRVAHLEKRLADEQRDGPPSESD